MLERYQGIKELISDAEKKFSVNQWMVEGISIWPIIRNTIFIKVIDRNQKNEVEEPKMSFFQKLRYFLYKRKKAFYFFLNSFYSTYSFFKILSGLDKKDNIFFTHLMCSVNFEGKKMDRFFDPLILKYDLTSYLFFYSSKVEGVEFNQKEERDVFFNLKRTYHNSLFSYYDKLMAKKWLVNVAFKEYNAFEKYIRNNNLTNWIADDYSERKVMSTMVPKWVSMKRFYSIVLKKIQPKSIFIICYYTDSQMIMTAVAKSLGIKVIEFQHGPVADKHLAYNNWNVKPECGYNTIPSIYWCWDDSTKKILDAEWGHMKGYQALIGGQPWVDFWKERDTQEFEIDEDIILFSCQPHPHDIKRYLSDDFINEIKNSSYKWYFRLHPRDLKNIEIIKAYLKEKGIIDYIVLEKASHSPLPVLLDKTLLHVSPVSGTVIEASLFGKYTLLVDPVGEDYYQDLVKAGKAEYQDPYSKSFPSSLNAIIERLEKEKNNLILDQEEGNQSVSDDVTPLFNITKQQ